MKRIFVLLPLLLALVWMGGCAWVKLDPNARAVRVANSSENLSSCNYKGEITTTVTNRVGGVERNSIKVADELETLARNEAATMGANTLQPQSGPVAGEQRFKAYSCY